MITIKFETANEAFDNFSKGVNYVLLQVQNIANDIEEYPTKYHLPAVFSLLDENGNTVGSVKFGKG